MLLLFMLLLFLLLFAKEGKRDTDAFMLVLWCSNLAIECRFPLSAVSLSLCLSVPLSLSLCLSVSLSLCLSVSLSLCLSVSLSLHCVAPHENPLK